MGSPISSTIAKYSHNIYIKQLLDTFYISYVDDILIIYDTKITHPDLINKHINQIHTNIKINPTHENNGFISFLELLIIQKLSNLEIDIFCKPATTDTTISFSNHSTEDNIVAFRYHITRMHSLPLTPKRKQ